MLEFAKSKLIIIIGIKCVMPKKQTDRNQRVSETISAAFNLLKAALSKKAKLFLIAIKLIEVSAAKAINCSVCLILFGIEI